MTEPTPVTVATLEDIQRLEEMIRAIPAQLDQTIGDKVKAHFDRLDTLPKADIETLITSRLSNHPTQTQTQAIVDNKNAELSRQINEQTEKIDRLTQYIHAMLVLRGEVETNKSTLTRVQNAQDRHSEAIAKLNAQASDIEAIKHAILGDGQVPGINERVRKAEETAGIVRVIQAQTTEINAWIADQKHLSAQQAATRAKRRQAVVNTLTGKWFWTAGAGIVSVLGAVDISQREGLWHRLQVEILRWLSNIR